MKDAHSLEDFISHTLALGTLLAILLLAIGLIMYATQTNALAVSMDSNWLLRGDSLEGIVGSVVGSLLGNAAYMFLGLGILALMFTQYARVIASALYFLSAKDLKYVGITLIVLTLLTLSLLGYL